MNKILKDEQFFEDMTDEQKREFFSKNCEKKIYEVLDVEEEYKAGRFESMSFEIDSSIASDRLRRSYNIIKQQLYRERSVDTMHPKPRVKIVSTLIDKDHYNCYLPIDVLLNVSPEYLMCIQIGYNHMTELFRYLCKVLREKFDRGDADAEKDTAYIEESK